MGKGGGKCASRERFASSSRTPRLPAPRHSTTFKPAESSRAVGPESSQSSIREPFLPKREETSQSTEHDPLKGEDDDLETDVIFDQPETVSESRRHLLSLSPADKMQNGSATKQPPAGASSQVALAASAKEEPTISRHEPKVEVSSIPVARAARKEPVLGDISTVSSTSIETKPPQHPPLTMDTGVRMVAPGGTKSQLNTKHITPAAESTQVSQVSALPLVVGMVYEMSNQVNKEDPSVFKKTNDVKEEATNSAFNVRKPDDLRDEKDTKKMEQENMRRSLLHGSRQPSRVEKRTTPALAEKTLVEAVNKGAPVVAQEENYSHIERAPMLPPFESKTQTLNESSAEKQPKEDVAPPTVEEMVIPTSRIDVEGIPIKPLEPKIPIEEEHALKAEVEDSEAPATLIKEARPKEVPLLESVKQALAAPSHNDPAPAHDAPPVEALENNKPITDRDPGPGPQVEAPPSLQALVQSEAQHTTSKAIDHEPDQDIWKSWKTKLETKALKGTPSPLLEKPDAPLVTQKALFPPESPQVLTKVETSVDEEKSSTVAHQALEHSTPNTERAPSPCSQQDQEEPPPSLVGLVQSEEHHKPPTINLKQDNWRSWKRTLESKVLKVPLTPQVEKKAPSVVPSKALLTSQYPPAPVPVPRPIPDEVAAPIEETSLQEEAANRGTPMKEHAVQEEASPLVEKNFIAPEADGAALVQAVESCVEEEKAIELEPEVKGTPATEAKNSQVDVAVPIEEAYVEAPLAKESPVVEERVVLEVEKGDLAPVQVEEQTSIAETPVEESIVEEEATPLVEKEFVAPEAEGVGPVEVVESPVEDEEAIELEPKVKGTPVTKKKDAGVDVATPIEEAYIEALLAKESPVVEEKAVSLAEELAPANVEEEVAIAETLVEESAVEEAAPFFEQREFVAPLEEVAAPVEVVESPVDEENTIELEPEVEGMPVTQQKDAGVDVADPIEEAYKEAPLSEESPVVEEKAVGEAEKEKLALAHVEKKVAFEENLVEESVVEHEAIPLDEEKEFVAPEAEVAARVEAMGSRFEEEKAIELEPEVKGTPLIEKKDAREDVATPVDEVYVEAPLAKERPLIEERSVREVEELAPGHMGKEAFFEDTPVQKSTMEGETNPLVVEKQFVAPKAEGVAPVEAVENVDEENAIGFEPKVEGTPPTEVENVGVDLVGPIDETYKEAPLAEDSPVLEDKAVLEGEEEELAPSHVEEDAAIEDTLVAKFAVEEEANPLLEEKRFFTPEAEGAGPVEAMESPIEEEKTIDLHAEVESEPATEVEYFGVDVAAPVDEAYEEAPLSKESPIVKEKAVLEKKNEELAPVHVEEEATVEDIPVEESAVEDEARPLVAEKEFVASEAVCTGPVEGVESPIVEKKAIESESNVKSEPAPDAEDSGVDVGALVDEAHKETQLSEDSPFVEEKTNLEWEELAPSQFVEEATVEESPVEESTVEEEARPLVEKEIVDTLAAGAVRVEAVESQIEEEKAIASELDVESEPATEAEYSRVDVGAPVEGAHEEALLSEERSVVEEKTSSEGVEELVPSQFVEEAAIEESPVEESIVEEELRPLVVEKEFVAPEAAGAGPVERVESPIVEKKAIELEANVESEPATEAEDSGVDVGAPVEEAYEETPLSKERLVVEEKTSPEGEEKELADSQFVEEAIVEESLVEESAVEEEARPLVVEKEFVAPEVAGVAPVEVVESPIEKKQAIELEPNVENEHAMEAEDSRGDVAAPVEAAHEEAPLSEERPVVEEKASPEGEEEELSPSQFVEESATEEEVRPLVAGKDFVAPKVVGAGPVESLENPIVEEKAIELEPNVESEPSTDEEDSEMDVGASVEEVHKEAPLSEESLVVEEKSSPEREEEESAPSQFLEEFAVEEEARPLVEEKEFIAVDAEGAEHLEGLESSIVEEKGIESEPTVESEPAMEAEDYGGEVAALVAEVYEQAPLLEERPVMEEKASLEGEEQELADSQFVEEATVEESPVEESAVKEEAKPLVAEKEFIAPEATGAGPVEGVESPFVEKKAIESEANVQSEPATEAEDSKGYVVAPIEEAHEEAPLLEERPVVHEKMNPEGEEELAPAHMEEEAAVEVSPVEESRVEEEARSLVVEKEFVAVDVEGAKPVEDVESPIKEEKAIELEPNAENEPALDAEDYGVDVGASVEEAHEEAPLLEERPFVEEKASPEWEEEELVPSQFVEEATVEERPVEESTVKEEARPLVEEKDFVAADAEGGGRLEGVESPIVEEKAIEWEPNVESEPATEAEDFGVDVPAPFEEAHGEAPLSEERPIVEESASSQFVEKTAVEESPVEESAVEEEARSLVAEKEFVAPEAAGVAPVEVVESPIEEEEAIKLEPNVESEPAMEAEDSKGDIAAPVEEAHEEAPLLEESPVVGEKESQRGEEEELAPSQIVEEGGDNETPVEKCAVDEEARPLVAEKEFVDAEAVGAALVEAVENRIEEEKAIELEPNAESEPASDAEDSEVDVGGPVEEVHKKTLLLEERPVVEEKENQKGEEEELAPSQMVEEGGDNETPVEECAVDEEARLLVEEKKFVDAEAVGAGPVESLESPIVEEKAIELEPNVESEPAAEAEDFGVDVGAPVEEAHEQASLSEDMPIVKEKSSPKWEEEELAPSQFVEEAAVKESPVEESVVEEETKPLVEEKQFVAPKVAGLGPVERVESPIVEEKGIESKLNVESEPATEAEYFGVDVGAPVKEAHGEAPLLEGRPVMQEKASLEVEEEELAPSQFVEKIAVEERPVEKFEVEEEARPLVAEKEFVAADAEGTELVEAVERPIKEEKAIELEPSAENEPAPDVEDSGGDVGAPVEEAHEEAPLLEERPFVEEKASPEWEEDELAPSQFVEEAAVEDRPVEESTVEEEARPLVEEERPLVKEKEFVTADVEGGKRLEGVNSPIVEEKAVESEPNVESEHATEAEDFSVDVPVSVEEAHGEALLSEESPVVEEKASPEGAELAPSRFVEEAAVEESPVEESAVEEEARPLVEEKEFVVPEAAGAGPVEGVESPIVEKKAIESEANVESEPATEAEDSGGDVGAPIEEAHEEAQLSEEGPFMEGKMSQEGEEEELAPAQFVREGAFEESLVKESAVEEEARPLVAEKEFVAADVEGGELVESLESPIVEEKAIESDPNVESEPAMEAEDSAVDVAALGEEAHKQAPLSEDRPVVEEKTSLEWEEEELTPSQFVEEAAIGESPVEESAMEDEARPFVAEKEFVAPEVAGAGPVEGVESPIVEKKAIESEPNAESEPTPDTEDFGADVGAPVEEAHEEAQLSEENPFVEEKGSPEWEEEELAPSQFVEEATVEERPVEEFAMEEEARPLVVEKEFVAVDAEGVELVEAVESPIAEEKAIEWELNVESEPAAEAEDSGVDVLALVEEVHEEAPLSEERAVVEEKASLEGEEEELAPAQCVEEAAVEESPVEESTVEEEARPLVEEKEFVVREAAGAARVEAVESPIVEEKAVESEPNVESEHATEAEDSSVDVPVSVEEAHGEALLSEESPVVEEKASPEGEEQKLADSQFIEEAAVEEIEVQKSVVEEEARALVAEKEFGAADAEGARLVESLENPIVDEKAIESEPNVESEPATKRKDSGVDVAAQGEEAHKEAQLSEESPFMEGKVSQEKEEEELALAQFVGEEAFEESPVKESAMEEEARPLVAEKEFIAVDADGAGLVESLENPIEEEMAIESEPNVENEPATDAEDSGVDVSAPGVEAHEEAPLLEESPFMEEKSSPEGEEEELAPTQFFEEGAVEETPVEESAVEEEARPLVEEKEFVAPEAVGAESVEGVQCLVKEEKAMELEPGFEASLLDVAAGIVEESVEEEMAMDMETNVDVARGIREAGLVEVVGVNADGYVEEPFVVGEYVIGMTDVVDDYFPGNIVRLRKNSEEASVDVHSGDPEFVGALSVPIVFENGAQVASLIGSDIELSGVTGFSPVIEVHGAKKKSDEVSIDVNLEICEDDGGARQNPITDNRGFMSEVDGFDLGHIGYSGAGLSEKILSEPFEHIEGKGVDVDNMSTMRAAEDKEAVSHGCAKDSMEGSEWELVAPQSVEVPNNTGNAIKAREDNEENMQRTKESPSHGTEEKSALATEWEFVAEELQDTHVKSEGLGVQSSPFERVKESTESSDWEMVPTGSGAKDENFAEYIEMTKESAEVPTTEEDEIADVPIGGGERVLNNTSEEKEPTSTRGLDREIPLIKVVQNKDQETEDVTVDVGVSEIESPLENLREENEFSIKSPYNVEHFKKRPLGVATRKLKHVIQEPKVKVHKVVLPTWPPSPITSEEDNTRVDIDHENAPVVESRHVPSVVDVEIIEEPSVATTGENMEVSEDPHTPKNDEQEETNLSGEEEHDSEAFSQFVSKDIQLASDKSKDMTSVLQPLENRSGIFISDLLLEGSEEVDAAPSA